MAVADSTNLKIAKSAKLAPLKPGIAYNQVDNAFRLTTPENISFEYQLAGPFRRVFPYVLDLLVIVVAYAALVFLYWLFALLVGGLFAFMGVFEVTEFIVAIGSAMGWIMLFLAYWFYGAYMETYYNGRTVGKMISNLRVLSTDGHAIDGVQATLRNFFRGIDLMPLVPVGGLLELSELPPQVAIPTGVFGLIAMSISPRFQRLGDLVAGTMVVNEDDSRDPHVQTFADSRVPQLAEAIPSSFYVSNSLAKAVAAYADHRDQLGIARSGEIASKLAGKLCEEFGLPSNTDSDLLICSLYYKIFVGQAPEESSAPDLPFPSAPPRGRYEPSPSLAVMLDPDSIDAGRPADPIVPVAHPIDISTNPEHE